MRNGQRHPGRDARRLAAASAAFVVGLAALPGLAVAQSPAAGDTLEIAYLSYAVANTYDAPMLEAAQAAAAAGNANITVFDANNDPAAQQTQLQDAVASGKYDGIIVQPIAGAALVAPVQAAIAAGVQVANMDQTLGADLTTSAAQVEGLAANVVFVPSEIGRKLGEQTVAACAQAAVDPCGVGYIFAFKGYPLDNAIREAFDAAIAGTPSVQVVAEGEGFFSAQGGLAAGQDMLTAHPDLAVLVGSDQAITGALQAAAGAGVSPLSVGFGGGAVALQEVAEGKRFATVMQLPATEGRLAVEQLINAIRTGTPAEGVDPVSQLSNDGVATQATAAEFTAEWPG